MQQCPKQYRLNFTKGHGIERKIPLVSDKYVNDVEVLFYTLCHANDAQYIKVYGSKSSAGLQQYFRN